MTRGTQGTFAVLAMLAMLAIGRRAVPRPRPPRGAVLTLEQLRALARTTGFADPNVAAAVAMAESGGHVDARGDGGASFGLWQVHTPSWPQFDKASLLTAEGNAHAAFVISGAGSDWTPWTTYTSGAYRKFLPPGAA